MLTQKKLKLRTLSLYLPPVYTVFRQQNAWSIKFLVALLKCCILTNIIVRGLTRGKNLWLKLYFFSFFFQIQTELKFGFSIPQLLASSLWHEYHHYQSERKRKRVVRPLLMSPQGLDGRSLYHRNPLLITKCSISSHAIMLLTETEQTFSKHESSH